MPQPSVLTPARRLLIRFGLAGGATVAALFGAQTLAMLDYKPISSNKPVVNAVNAVTAQSTPTAAPAIVATAARRRTAPLIIIIRNPGKASPSVNNAPVSNSANSGNAANNAMQPPAPVVSQPVSAPVVVEAAPAQPAPVTAPTGG